MNLSIIDETLIIRNRYLLFIWPSARHANSTGKDKQRNESAKRGVNKDCYKISYKISDDFL